MHAPSFSVVIPMFNRAAKIGRALQSCLRQENQDFEIVVVDDGSSDGSVEAVKEYGDPRIRLFLHDRNQGVCPARNTGVAQARGEWVLFLDSDDEFLPGALAAIEKHVRRAPAYLNRFAFRYELDTGGFSPSPPFQDSVWDYVGYLNWMERAEGSTDYFNCVRRSTFERVRFPAGRAYETLYHLDFAWQFKTRCAMQVVAKVNSDCANRSCLHSADDRRRDALDCAESLDALLGRHGQALRDYAPKRYRTILKMCASMHACAGHRLKSCVLNLNYLRRQPFSPEGWLQLGLGLLGPGVYTWAATHKNRVALAKHGGRVADCGLRIADCGLEKKADPLF